MNLLLGIGNELNGDDAVGCYIARNFRSEGWQTIDCGTVPENYIGVVKRIKPELLVIIDAAEMGLQAGAIRRLKKEYASSAFISTHSLPLKEFISAIEKYAKKILLIGIQPKQTSLGTPLSSEAKGAAAKLMEILEQEKWLKIEEFRE